MTTIRDIIKQIQTEISSTDDLQPDRAAEMLTKLSAFYLKD